MQIWLEVAVRFGIDILAMSILLFAFYYRRHRDKELATTAGMFNIYTFCILSILSSVNFTVAAGFGLFAILALFSLRSEPFSKIEITYFFGAVAIAVICSVKGSELPLVGMIVTTVLAGAYLLDHPGFLRSVDGVKMTLDKVETYALSDGPRMKEELSEKLGVEVLSYQITTLDYVRDLALINVYFKRL